MKLAPLTFVRPGELRHAEWSEFDLDAAEWRIPGHRMKMGERHMVPLSSQAVAILRELEPLTGPDGFVFPSIRDANRPMSENTVNAGLRRLGYSREEQTGHGFRSIASTCLNELGYNSDLIELQLAHAERNKVRAAYNRAERLVERRKMMQAWGVFLLPHFFATPSPSVHSIAVAIRWPRDAYASRAPTRTRDADCSPTHAENAAPAGSDAPDWPRP